MATSPMLSSPPMPRSLPPSTIVVWLKFFTVAVSPVDVTLPNQLPAHQQRQIRPYGRTGAQTIMFACSYLPSITHTLCLFVLLLPGWTLSPCRGAATRPRTPPSPADWSRATGVANIGNTVHCNSWFLLEQFMYFFDLFSQPRCFVVSVASGVYTSKNAWDQIMGAVSEFAKFAAAQEPTGLRARQGPGPEGATGYGPQVPDSNCKKIVRRPGKYVECSHTTQQKYVSSGVEKYVFDDFAGTQRPTRFYLHSPTHTPSAPSPSYPSQGVGAIDHFGALLFDQSCLQWTTRNCSRAQTSKFSAGDNPTTTRTGGPTLS